MEEYLPIGWITCTLEEVAEWGSGGTPSRNNPNYFSGAIPWIKTGELGPKYIHRADEYITEEAVQKSSAKIFPKGSVGIAMYGATIGKLSIWGIDASTNQACAVAQPYSEVLFNEYLYYFLFSEKRDIIGAGKGGAQPNISQGILKQWKIPIPPLNEQKRIVAKIEELFSELDKGIESLKTAREQLKVYRQAVLKHAFEGKLTAEWRERNKDKLETVDQLLERIKGEREAYYQIQLEEWKESIVRWEMNGKEGNKPSQPKSPDKIVHILDEDLQQLPKLPHGWMWIKLLNISKNIQIGPFGSLLHQHDYVAGGLPLVNPSHIKNQQIDPDYNLTITSEKLKELANYRLQEGDVIMGRRGEMGRCAVVTKKEAGWLCGTGSLFVRLLDSYIPWFYCQVLSSQRAKEYLSSSSIGTTMQNLNQKILFEMPVPVCSIEEQIEIMKEIKRQFSVIDGLEKTIYSELEKTEALRQSILKKAFSGELVAQDPNDEPASVLLERIRAEKEAQEMAGKKPKQNEERLKVFMLTSNEAPASPSLWTIT